MLLDFSPPQGADHAVALACDAGYLPYALHLAHQIVLASPSRDFDILIASDQPLELPGWALRAGISNLVCDVLRDAPQLRTQWLTSSTYLRLFLPDLLADRYRRALYLDCDIFLEGGDLGRLLRVDLGGHALGAVKDVDAFLDPRHHSAELKILSEPAHVPLNAGLLLIDIAAWQREELRDQCLQLGARRPEVFVKHDQSLLNGVLKGRFAELSPVWNWMMNQRFPLLTRRYPVRMRHFVGPVKPWRDPNGRHDARHRQSYAEFFRRAGLTEAAAAQSPVHVPPRLMPLDVAMRHVLDQQRMRRRLEAELDRFRDEWDVKP
jgi:lipopolysaccharide biosynthesis glycosyltransferase